MNDKIIEPAVAELQATTQEIAKIETAITEKVAMLQTQLASLREKDSQIRAKIKEAMEANDVKKFENDFIAITYVAPFSRKSLDTTKLKAEQPELYDKYSKESAVAASVRFKVKEA